MALNLAARILPWTPCGKILQVFEGCEHLCLWPLTPVTQLFLSFQPFCVQYLLSTPLLASRVLPIRKDCTERFAFLKILGKVRVVSLKRWRFEVLPRPLLLGSSVALVKAELSPGWYPWLGSNLCVLFWQRGAWNGGDLTSAEWWWHIGPHLFCFCRCTLKGGWQMWWPESPATSLTKSCVGQMSVLSTSVRL